MKYIFFLALLFFVIYFLLFSSINPTLVSLDFYFFKLPNITLGFAIIGSVLTGAVISFILQIPLIFKKNKKVKNDEDKT
tara:strand:- start:6787 stop:7023 length:237 start_codon:yes stop_codon:yes gene_type:complete